MKTFMKHITLITILSLSFFNCSNDDDNTSQEEIIVQELIIGKWFYSDINEVPVGNCSAQSYYHFLDAENVIFYDLSASLFDPEDCFTFLGEQEMTYVLEDNDQIVTFNSTIGSYSRQIISISESNLVLDFIGEEAPHYLNLVKE